MPGRDAHPVEAQNSAHLEVSASRISGGLTGLDVVRMGL